MNENQKISQLLVLFGLLILAIIFVLMSFQKNTENIKKSRFTICEIVPKDEGDTRVWFDAKFEYFVAGVKFTFLKNPKKNQFNVIGEKFVLEYDENDPDKHRIISYKPLFLEEEKTNFTTGRVLRVVRFRLNKNISTHAVYFEYTVNNISYKKAQNLPISYFKEFPQLKNNATFVVEYWLKNPKRAIMYLDKPCCKSHECAMPARRRKAGAAAGGEIIPNTLVNGQVW